MSNLRHSVLVASLLAGLGLSSWAFLPAAAQDPAPPESGLIGPGAIDALGELLGAEGIEIDREVGALSLPAEVLVTSELLEYLLVGPGGAGHESLLTTEAKPSILNAGLLALGIEPGRNAHFEAVVPYPTEAELKAGAEHHRMVLPRGDGVFIYLAWREGDEVYFLRVEDALCNLDTNRTMRRHRWVYLGSQFKPLASGGDEVFMADEQQNLINLSFFVEGNTLVTGSLPECERQTIWVANSWALPPRGQGLRMIISHERLGALPTGFLASLPEPDRSLPIK